jgi:hypothetical protein
LGLRLREHSAAVLVSPPRGHAGFGSDLANEALVHEICREFLNRDALDAVKQADCAILALRRARERDENRLRLHDHQGIHNARRKPRVRRSAGASVVVPARDLDRAATALEGLDVEIQPMNLSDPASIDAFAARFIATAQPGCTLARCSVGALVIKQRFRTYGITRRRPRLPSPSAVDCVDSFGWKSIVGCLVRAAPRD